MIGIGTTDIDCSITWNVAGYIAHSVVRYVLLALLQVVLLFYWISDEQINFTDIFVNKKYFILKSKTILFQNLCLLCLLGKYHLFHCIMNMYSYLWDNSKNVSPEFVSYVVCMISNKP